MFTRAQQHSAVLATADLHVADADRVAIVVGWLDNRNPTTVGVPMTHFRRLQFAMTAAADRTTCCWHDAPRTRASACHLSAFNVNHRIPDSGAQNFRTHHLEIPTRLRRVASATSPHNSVNLPTDLLSWRRLRSPTQRSDRRSVCVSQLSVIEHFRLAPLMCGTIRCQTTQRSSVNRRFSSPTYGASIWRLFLMIMLISCSLLEIYCLHRLEVTFTSPLRVEFKWIFQLTCDKSITNVSLTLTFEAYIYAVNERTSLVNLSDYKANWNKRLHKKHIIYSF